MTWAPHAEPICAQCRHFVAAARPDGLSANDFLNQNASSLMEKANAQHEALAVEEHQAGMRGQPLTREPQSQPWCAHWTTVEPGHIQQDRVTGRFFQRSYVLCISRNNNTTRCTAYSPRGC